MVSDWDRDAGRRQADKGDEQWGQREGVMNSPIAPVGIARRMILAIVTSREFYPGNFKWFHCAKLFRGVKGKKWRRCDETTEGMCLSINAI